MRQQTAIVLALVVAAVSVIGAASYTQATVDRDANINVETDSAALVGLSVGGGITDSSITTTDGELSLDLDGASGVNGNAMFHYGADGTNTPRDHTNTAINVTNNDDESRTFDLSYTQATTSDGTNSNVQFDVYTYDSVNNTFTQVGTVDEEGGPLSQTLAAGETLNVFITVDTSNLDSTTDLSGTFTVTAS